MTFNAVYQFFLVLVEADEATVSLRSLVNPKYLNPALKTLAEVLTDPRFSAVAVSHVKQNMLSAISDSQQYPGAIASQDFRPVIYGTHYFQSLSVGASQADVSHADIRERFQQWARHPAWGGNQPGFLSALQSGKD